MTLWIILAAVIVGISFILAYSSMRDLQESPKDFNLTYGLYLIRREDGLTEALLEKVHQELTPERALISFEGLMKGTKRALTIFGPAAILRAFIVPLDLLELEDYSKQSEETKKARFWEAGFKKGVSQSVAFPELLPNEQIWRQVLLLPKKNGGWFSVMRTAVLAEDNLRAEKLEKMELEAEGKSGLITIPEAYSDLQFGKFYHERSTSRKILYGAENKDVVNLLT